MRTLQFIDRTVLRCPLVSRIEARRIRAHLCVHVETGMI